jgi:transketolase
MKLIDKNKCAMRKGSSRRNAHASTVTIKKNIINLVHQTKEGHIPSALSILDLLSVLYGEGFINKEGTSRFVLSKGHGSLALYAILAENGFFDPKELSSFCQYESRFGGHPDRNKVKGVEASTGSLGHGFPIAVGMAMAEKIKRTNNKVYVIIGDGEANEGTVWEAALLATHHKLNNLYCIVDFNHSTDRALELGDLKAKFSAFGWHTICISGHDRQQIKQAYSHSETARPVAIIAETIKGRGCRPMENNPEWHHKNPTTEELPLLLKELY